MKMQRVEIPEFPGLRDEKAMEALNDFIDEIFDRVMRKNGEELTDAQAIIMIRFAKGLMSSIKAEKLPTLSDKDNEEESSVVQLKQTFLKHILDRWKR